MKRRALLLAAACLWPMSAPARPVTAEGIALVRGGDVGRARGAALADALRQALAQGGLKVSSRSTVDQNVLREDSFTATATGRITTYDVADEWREDNEYHVRVRANLEAAGSDAARCDASLLTSVGALRLDADTGLDPLITRPMAEQSERRLRLAFGTDASTGFGPSAPPTAAARTGAELYAAIAYGNTRGAGVFLRPTLRLARHRMTGPLLVRGERVDVTLAIELIDAATGTPIGRAQRQRSWTLASRAWEYLPADLRPDRRAIAPNPSKLVEELIEDVRARIGCRPIGVAVAGARDDQLVLEGGDVGLRPGDLLVTDARDVDGIAWPAAQVTSVNRGDVRARLLEPSDGRAAPKSVSRIY